MDFPVVNFIMVYETNLFLHLCKYHKRIKSFCFLFPVNVIILFVNL